MRNALKAAGALLVVLALCAPLILLPGEDTGSGALGYAGATLTVPPTVLVAATIPGQETTTTTTTAPSPPPAEPTSTTTTTEGPIDITIAVAGNITLPQAVLDSVRDPQTNSYNFDPIFAPIAPYLSRADYALAALEPRLAGPGAGYSAEPVANAPRELAFSLKHAGIDLLATANPHSLDFGWEGIVGTLGRLDAAGIAHVGTSRSQEERETPVIVDIRGIRVAFLNYTDSLSTTGSAASTLATDTTAAGSTEATGSDKETTLTTAADKETTTTTAAEMKGTETTTTGTTVTSSTAEGDRPYAVNRLDLATVSWDAMMARSWGADAVVVMVSYGREYDQEPNADQLSLFGEILNSGVDAIFGLDGRVVQRISHVFTYTGWPTGHKYLAYSLGDFLFAERPDSPSGGLIAYLDLEKRGLRTLVTGVSYLPLYLQVSPAASASSSSTSASGKTAPSSSTSTSHKVAQAPARYRILPVLPGLYSDTDIPLTPEDRARMAQIWEDARSLLYRPDENISPLVPANLGL